MAILNNLGVQNEFNFIKEINKKKYSELNILLQELILHLFPCINGNEIINCYKNKGYEKGDICIRINDSKKYISIKMGNRNSVHGEEITTFNQFLRNIGVSKNVINEINKYHYADGTIDGTGTYRMSITEYKKENEKKIEMINKYINKERIIKMAIDRFIIRGIHASNNKIDVLVCGTPTNFIWISQDEIYKYILGKKDNFSSAIHFSCLTFQPMHRVLDYNKNKEHLRKKIQIKWYNLEDNIIEYMNEKNMQNSY